MAGPIHYEVYVRKTDPAPWSLLMAVEDRKIAIETAEDLLKDDRAAAVRVTKETLEPETMEFASVTILTKGAPEVKRKRLVSEEEAGPSCRGPQDFYTPHARELIGRVLEDWLARQGATAFELLHRPDLAERLDASGVELQHAIQKTAVPESQAVGQSVHDLVRRYQKLSEQAIERLMALGRSQKIPDLTDRSIADVAHRLSGKAERGLLMGAAVAGALAPLRGARTKLGRLMDLAEGAPAEGPPRALALVPIEQLASEMLSARTSLAEILGPALDQGGSLAAVVRMIAPREVDAVLRVDPDLALLIPPLDGPAARLAERLAAGDFPLLATALARMVARELKGPRRLRPADAVGEIEILRALATLLTAASDRLLSQEEVLSAFAERSKSLVTADFVAAYVKGCPTVLDEAQNLAWLCENVTGASNKRSAARWMSACVSSLRFESEMRQAGQTASQKLLALAALQRSARLCDLSEIEEGKLCDAIGAVGDVVERETRLVAQLSRARVSTPQKLGALLRLASGEAAPLGPAADRAKAEALRLFRQPQTRADLTAAPEAIAPLKDLMRAAGLAA
ncbi:hypothetical protein E4M02_04760 [Brevundimonas sp. S30B]|uniref:hypothetical protein n=1 Tax=unclassified Brevundimonas TaxID=2622653 RepID=UPI001071BA52|nr:MULTISPECIES: hypothetical protein [unclassified Brevundimonas]QBX36820.1 hypothetical protein E4M01_03055 [Brevundimonas sp. MF30-B]TFW04385.1 hypothetical protein E4M02_04760 [Brevundimonas sp. S30B]